MVARWAFVRPIECRGSVKPREGRRGGRILAA